MLLFSKPFRFTSFNPDYKASLDLNELKLTLDGSNDVHATIRFGDGKAFVISKDNIHNVIPEIVE